MITREEMENIANLAKLYLSEDDFEKMSKEMDGIINFVNQVNTLSDQYDLEKIDNLGTDVDEDALRNVIKHLSLITGKEVSKEKEDKIISTIVNDKVPDIGKMI